MADDLVRFIVDGSKERHGNIPADVFLSRFRLFVATIYGLDRAFSKRSKRSIDLDIVDLRRENPAVVAMRPHAQVGGYDAEAAMEWTMGQLERIRDAKHVDGTVAIGTIDNVVELSRFQDRRRLPVIDSIRVEYRGRVVRFDQHMEHRALALRTTRSIETENLWKTGVSKGTLFGELRGVMDMNGEREFFIVPPSGAERVRCLFPEEMRDAMNAHLFKVVRVHGFLRYDGTTPFPQLVEADSKDGVPATTSHFLDFAGAFADYEMPEGSELP